MWSNLVKLWQLSGLFRGATAAIGLLVPVAIGLVIFRPGPPNPGGGGSGTLPPSTNAQANAGTLSPSTNPQAQSGNAPTPTTPSPVKPPAAPPTTTPSSPGAHPLNPIARIPVTPIPTTSAHPPDTATVGTPRASAVTFPSPGSWEFLDQGQVAFVLTIEGDNRGYNDGPAEASITKFFEVDGNVITFKRRNEESAEITESRVGRFSATADPKVWEFQQLRPVTKTFQLRKKSSP